jgi:hypothetical protein
MKASQTEKLDVDFAEQNEFASFCVQASQTISLPILGSDFILLASSP